MDDSFQDKLTMYQAVKAVCEAKPSVWQRSETFADAFADFCQCIDNIAQLQAAVGIFRSVARGIPVQTAVADTILTTEMDELIKQFEQVDDQFVDDYTAARAMLKGCIRQRITLLPKRARSEPAPPRVRAR